MRVTREQAVRIGDLVAAQLINDAERNLSESRRTELLTMELREMADGSGLPALFTYTVTPKGNEHEVRVIVHADGHAVKDVLR